VRTHLKLRARGCWKCLRVHNILNAAKRTGFFRKGGQENGNELEYHKIFSTKYFFNRVE
jgi:hypothetical protein